MRNVATGPQPRRRLLASCILAALALAGPALVRAAVLPVTSCADDGSAGTLREVIYAAHDRDVVDLTQLTCSTITLTQGAINRSWEGNRPIDYLTVVGPGRDALTISGNGQSALFRTGGYGLYGYFAIRDLTIAHGHNTRGGAGCVTTIRGTLMLRDVTVTDCHGESGSSAPDGNYLGFSGGAVWAENLVAAQSSFTDSSYTVLSGGHAVGGGVGVDGFGVLADCTVTGNSISSPVGTAGGGVYSFVDLVVIGSTISGNSAEATGAGQDATGGGVFVRGNAMILDSTISGNTVDGNGGGLYKFGYPDLFNNGSRLTIQNSTISGNIADGFGAAVVSEGPTSIDNSTIASNNGAAGAAVMFRISGTPLGYPTHPSLGVQGTIIFGNLSGPSAAYAADLATDTTLDVSGSHSLIGDAGDIALPPDTVHSDPLLLPLADNGGPRQTMALAPGSPAIDAGINPLVLQTDGRGDGYVRRYGAAPDIGAYEVQPLPLPAPAPAKLTARPSALTDRTPMTLPVTSCADDGSPGTLRTVAAEAHEGDTLDLTQLTCSTITLTQGPIDLSAIGPNPLANLTIAGPGQDALTISGNGTSAVFLAGSPRPGRNNATLTLQDLTIAHGAKYDMAACVASVNSVVLERVTVTDCHAVQSAFSSFQGGGAVSAPGLYLTDSTIRDSSVAAANQGFANGGGAWAWRATLLRSTISGNTVTGSGRYTYFWYQTSGGGLYTNFSATLTDSTISGNSVAATAEGASANGGGIASRAFLTIDGSTLSGNSADGVGGGFISPSASYPQQRAAPNQITIQNSTVSGNRARFGGAFGASIGATVANSTFAFNTSADGGAVAFPHGATANYTYNLNLDSTIIASNLTGPAPTHAADLGIDPRVTLNIIGDHNLIGAADAAIVLPPDTLRDAPLLLPLAWNGGPTQTLALASGSPAIDAGSNPLALDTDQRGQGYARVVGAAADIGAYEAQPVGDVIFVNGFDP